MGSVEQTGGDGEGWQAPPIEGAENEAEPQQKSKKPPAFYMSLLALGLLSLITSWDATSLAVALPVSS